MTLLERWDAVWARLHAPVDPRVPAVLRIGLGAVVFFRLLLSLPDAAFWWGESGILPESMAHAFNAPEVGSVFWLLPDHDLVTFGLIGLATVQAGLLMVGWKSRFQAACVFVWLVSIQARNAPLTDGGDATLRVFLACLAFMPLGAVWSVDAARGRGDDPETSGLPVRLVRLQTVMVLLVAGLEKMRGETWLDGTAMSYVFLLDDFSGNLPVPDALRSSLLVSQLMSWGALGFEMLVPIAVWFERTRRPAVAVSIGFHLALLWMMNIFWFEWIMILGWCAFWNPKEDRAWLARWVPALRERG